MTQFQLRGLEIHSSRMWRWASVQRALEVMSRIGLNALIFHQNDLIDQLVFPEAYFSVMDMWKRWPVRMHTIQQNRHYIRRVVQEAKKLGIDFYLEVKEIYYPEALLDIRPTLRQPDGAICATDPFWWEFLETKTRELLKEVPEIAGVIVSAATRESKVSISTNQCKCPRCQTLDPLEWYHRILASLYGPLQEKGKKLVVRDFSYTAAHQNLAIDAASLCSKDIIIALKNTPHDFYPTFPNNPRIGQTNGHPQWVEFDTWGQFFGIGFFPVSVVEDLKQRIDFCRQHGVAGVWFRTDWEGMIEGSSFNSFNLLNVFAGGMLAQNPAIDLDEIYQTWTHYGLLSVLKSESCMETPVVPQVASAWERLKEFMMASWSVMEKAVYVRGHIIHEDMMFPLTMQLAFDMMVKIHGRDDWEPGAAKRVEATAENIEAILTEKQAALAEVKLLSGILQPRSLGLPESLGIEIGTMLDLYQYYVQGFYVATAACFFIKKASLSRQSSDSAAARRWINDLDVFRKELADRLKDTTYPHYVYWLLDTQRLEMLSADLKKNLHQ